MPLSPGSRLGPYEIVAPLGAGGMGEVYRARDTRLGREVAVKVLPQHLSANPELRARFEREAKTISALNHPHICTLFDVGREGETDFLVMELMEGEPLSARLARGALPLNETLRVGAQIAEALDRAHRAGVVHRDLKPGNIMLTKAGAKLMDFGLARATDSTGPASASGVTMAALTQTAPGASPLTAEGALVGTFQYMAPEQLEGGDADARSDLWALGCVLYEMASGTRAFDGKSQASLITAIMGREPAPISQVAPLTPPALERIVEACLAKDPADRVQSAHDVRLQLQWLAGGGSQSGVVPPAVTVAPVAPARARRAKFVAALAGVLLVGALAGYFARDRTAPTSVGSADVTYKALTFEDGFVFGARFAPDGRTIVYSADWDDHPRDVYVTSLDSPDYRPLGLMGADLLAVSRSGELAILDHSTLPTSNAWGRVGTLARASLTGGAARAELENVRYADIAADGTTAVVRLTRGLATLEYPPGNLLASCPNAGTAISQVAGIFNPRISPDGKHVGFFERRGADSLFVRVVDREGKTVARSPLIADWWGIAWSPRGDLWYGSNDVAGAQTILNSLDLRGHRRILYRSPGSLTLHDISPAGDVLATIEHTPTHVEVLSAGESTPVNRSWRGAGDLSAASDRRQLLLSQFGESGGEKGAVYFWDAAAREPVKIADGRGVALSFDGRQALVVSVTSPIQASIVSTGAGQPRTLNLGAIAKLSWGGWRPDGSIVLDVVRPGLRSAVYVLSADGRTLAESLPAGMALRGGNLISPDGARIVAVDVDGRPMLCTFGSKSGVPLPGAQVTDEVAAWAPDGRSVFVYGHQSTPARIERLDIITGARSPWKQITPLEPAVTGLQKVIVLPDGSVTYGYSRYQSELFLIRGLK